MYNLMREELEVSCLECPDVKAGFIGEVGSTWPIEGMQSSSTSCQIVFYYHYNYL